MMMNGVMSSATNQYVIQRSVFRYFLKCYSRDWPNVIFIIQVLLVCWYNSLVYVKYIRFIKLIFCLE